MVAQFIVVFQSADREGSVACKDELEVAEQIIFHKNHGHIVSVVPREIVDSEEFC